MKMFRISLTARSEKELQMRIEDSINRGFKVKQIIKPEMVHYTTRFMHQVDKFKRNYHVNANTYSKHRAIMEREDQRVLIH